MGHWLDLSLATEVSLVEKIQLVLRFLCCLPLCFDITINDFNDASIVLVGFLKLFKFRNGHFFEQ